MVQQSFNCLWQGAELAHHIERKKNNREMSGFEVVQPIDPLCLKKQHGDCFTT